MRVVLAIILLVIGIFIGYTQKDYLHDHVVKKFSKVALNLESDKSILLACQAIAVKPWG